MDDLWGRAVEPSGFETIGDDELLYRRVPLSANPSRYDDQTKRVKFLAFEPHKENDTTGLSLFRAALKSAGTVARSTRSSKPAVVAVLRVGDIRRAGMSVAYRPETPAGHDPAHVEIPELNSANRKLSRTQSLEEVLASLVLFVEGPFDSSAEPPPGDA